MLKSLVNFRWKEALPRILADFAVVQAAAIVSLIGVLLWKLNVRPWVNGAEATRILSNYYFEVFFPLSAIFPIVFLLSGFYTRSRWYATTYKWRVIIQGCGIATLFYLFANFLLTRADVLPRSATLLFVVLVTSGTIGMRWLKDWLVDHEALRNSSATASPSRRELVLLVGGAGYIGSVLCRRLLADDKMVRVLDSLIYGDAAIRDLLSHPNFQLVHGDCRNIQTVVGAVKGVDSIIHLAAIVGDPACEQEQQTALEVNYAATRMLIEVAKGNGVSRLLFASSCSVYGATDVLVDEMSEVEPISLYAQTKLDSEEALLRACTHAFHPVILRLATVFGCSHRPRFDLVVNLLCAKAYKEGALSIFNGEQWRPFIHVQDVATGFMQVLTAPLELVSGEIFNLGDSRLNHTLFEVAETIRDVFPHTHVEKIVGADRRNYRVSFDKIRNRLGFERAFSLRDGIHEIKRAFEGEEIEDYKDIRYYNQKFLQISGSPARKDEIDAQIMAAFAQNLVGRSGLHVSRPLAGS